jgi:hypothetical protein
MRIFVPNDSCSQRNPGGCSRLNTAPPVVMILSWQNEKATEGQKISG